MVNHSLRAMFVLSLSAGLAMSMRGRMEISLAPSAKLGTRGTKVNEANLKCVCLSCVNFHHYSFTVQKAARVKDYSNGRFKI